MENYPNKTPIDREISINPSSILMCKINSDGIIEYVNHSFSEVSGYEEFEIIGESMDILRHPDVPEIIYEILRERLSKNESIKLIDKQLAKDGRYYWLLSEFETKLNDAGELVAHYGHSVTAPTFAVHKISALYKILLKIESKSSNTEVSKRYLIGFLEERNLNYNQFIDELCANQPEYEKPLFQQPQIVNKPIVDLKPKPSIQDQNTGLYLNNLNYNANLDLSNLNQAERPKQNRAPVKKKKSLLKKVFGK